MSRTSEHDRERIWRHLTSLTAAFVLLLSGHAANAQQDTASGDTAQANAASAGRESPAATLQTFLTAMNEGDRETAAACLNLSLVRREEGPVLADLLLGILNRIEYVEPAWHPDERQVEREDLQRYTFFPREGDDNHASIRTRADLTNEAIVLARGEDGAWRFSAETVAGIRELYRRMETIEQRFGAADAEVSLYLWLRSHMPRALVDGAFLGIEYWQWIGLLLLIFLGLAIDLIVRALLSALARRIIARRGGSAASDTLRRTVRPFGLATAGVVWLTLVPVLGLPGPALLIVLPAVRLFAMLAMVWAAYRLTDLTGEVFSSKAGRTDTKFDDLLVPLVRKTVKIFITIFGLIYIANSFDVPLAPLLTGLGIGGAGFAFAAKDTIEHFFGSVTVIADRPFQVGDWVKINDTEGTVEEVGFRSTRIRTFYNSLITVPNGNLVRAVVDNYGQRKYRRWSTHLNVTYDTPPDRIEAFCEGIRELIRVHPYTRKDYYQVWLHQFGPHSLDVLVYVFFETPDWSTELRERHRLMIDIIRLADQLGVQFAFPTQTLHLFREEADGDDQPQEAPQRGEEFSARLSGRRAVRELIEHARWRERKPGPYRFLASDEDDEDDDDDTQIESKIGGNA